MLELYASAVRSAPFWDESVFSASAASGSWRLGRSGISDGDAIFLAPAADLLERSYGNEAPARISRVQAEIALHSSDPALGSDDVYFGILLQSAEGEDKYRRHSDSASRAPTSSVWRCTQDGEAVCASSASAR